MEHDPAVHRLRSTGSGGLPRLREQRDPPFLALGNLGYRERHRDGSNQFIYSRFLLPHLTGYSGWALYIDGDMLLRADIAALWNLRNESKAVMCVHHDYRTRMRRKYLGAKNEDYPRKNWSSVVLWNCGHPANRP